MQDIFLGTGVGPRAYAIIEQGRIGFIVSSRATWLHGATIDLDGGEIPVL